MQHVLSLDELAGSLNSASTFLKSLFGGVNLDRLTVLDWPGRTRACRALSGLVFEFTASHTAHAMRGSC